MSEISYNYSVPPGIASVRELLTTSGFTIPADFGNNLFQLYIDATVGDIEHRTGRQFVPGCPSEVRYYDGSGTGEMVIDEYVSIESVEILTVPGVGASYALNWYEKDINLRPKTKIQIYQGPPNYGQYWQNFPQGRSNIKVTAQFGYAATIPAEVYLAIMQGAAAQIGAALTMRSRDDSFVPGRFIEWKDADRSEKYADMLVGDAIGWSKNYEQTIIDHSKPRRRKQRRLY